MCKLVINGGNNLWGDISVQGSKNALLPILAATYLTGDECVIHNCPCISDLKSAFLILDSLGCRTDYYNNTARICADGADGSIIQKNLMEKMRSSIMFLGAILARRKEALICRPGGCRLGDRPIDIHIDALLKLGAEITENGDCIYCKIKKLKSEDITLLYPSVGATENIMLLCAGGNVNVRVYNPAREPEIVDLQNFLNLMGANICGAGSDCIKIKRVSELHGCTYRVMPDRIVAGTYMCMTAACGGELRLEETEACHMRAVCEALKRAGCEITETQNGLTVKSDGNAKGIGTIKTLPYPGFPTDMQPQLCAALASGYGYTRACETIFENRFGYIKELKKMGASVKKKGQSLIVNGCGMLRGAELEAEDLRGGAALVCAALSATGKSVVSGVEFIDRGYDGIEKELAKLGASIRRL